MKRARPPAAVMSAVTFSPSVALMSFTMTAAPSAASRRAMPSPMPPPAPVTMMDLPETRMLLLLLMVVKWSLVGQFSRAARPPIREDVGPGDTMYVV